MGKVAVRSLLGGLACSVIVIVCNKGTTLRDCIASIEGQIQSPNEILVDNGSTNSTTAIASSTGIYAVNEPLRWVGWDSGSRERLKK